LLLRSPERRQRTPGSAPGGPMLRNATASTQSLRRSPERRLQTPGSMPGEVVSPLAIVPDWIRGLKLPIRSLRRLPGVMLRMPGSTHGEQRWSGPIVQGMARLAIAPPRRCQSGSGRSWRRRTDHRRQLRPTGPGRSCERRSRSTAKTKSAIGRGTGVGHADDGRYRLSRSQVVTAIVTHWGVSDL
jgi:hypothetical protein